MKTNSFSFKRCALALSLIVLSSIVIGSCRKEKLSDNEVKTNLIGHSREFFQQTVLANEKNMISYLNFKNNLKKEPNWSKASVINTGAGEAVIVPINYKVELKAKSDNLAGTTRPFSYLMLYSDKKGTQHAEYITLISGSHLKSDNGKFIGTVVVEDWYGKFLKAFAYGVEGDILPLSLSEAKIFKKINYKSVYCYSVQYYGHNYAEGYPESDYWYLGGTETYCFGSIDTEDSDGPNPSDYGQGGTSGYSDPRETSEMHAFEQDYKARMSPSELAIFNNMWRWQQLDYLTNARTAEIETAAKFPSYTLHNDQADAYRHAFFSLLNVDSFGQTLAKSLGDAHENMAGQPTIERNMDLYNNEKGRQAYTGYFPGVQIWEFYSNIAYNLALSGSLKYIKNGVLTPTDQ